MLTHSNKTPEKIGGKQHSNKTPEKIGGKQHSRAAGHHSTQQLVYTIISDTGCCQGNTIELHLFIGRGFCCHLSIEQSHSKFNSQPMLYILSYIM